MGRARIGSNPAELKVSLECRPGSCMGLGNGAGPEQIAQTVHRPASEHDPAVRSVSRTSSSSWSGCCARFNRGSRVSSIAHGPGRRDADAPAVGRAEAWLLLGQVEAIDLTHSVVVSRKVADFLASDASDASPYIRRHARRARAPYAGKGRTCPMPPKRCRSSPISRVLGVVRTGEAGASIASPVRLRAVSGRGETAFLEGLAEPLLGSDELAGGLRPALPECQRSALLSQASGSAVVHSSRQRSKVSSAARYFSVAARTDSAGRVRPPARRCSRRASTRGCRATRP